MSHFFVNGCNLQELILGYNFNQKLGNSLLNLINLRRLTLGYEFNHELEIPSNIEYLHLDCNNIKLIDSLPNSLVELEFGYGFDLELNNLPNSIKIIKFEKTCVYNQELNNLPKSLEHLELNKSYNKKITTVYPNLKTILCSPKYGHSDVFVSKGPEMYDFYYNKLL